MINLDDFSWKEQNGRLRNDEPFHEWTLSHATGRIVAIVAAPHDNTGGFMFSVVFLFNQQVMMRESPFEFVDFDSAKAFTEASVIANVEDVSPAGALRVYGGGDPLSIALKEGMEGAMAAFKSVKMGVAIPDDNS